MKKFAFGAAILLVGLGLAVMGGNHARAAEVTIVASPAGLSSQDAAMLKQGLDILKQTLDLLQAKISAAISPISNAAAINSSLQVLKSSLRQIDSTLAALGNAPGQVAVSPNPAIPVIAENQESEEIANNQLASVESSFDLKKLTWPVIAILAVIVAALAVIVLRRRMVRSKLGKVQKNIQEMKEKASPAQQNVGL